MKIVHSILLFLLTILFLSCGSLRNEVDPSQLGVESAKLVVSSFLSPQDTTLAVKVTRSATVVGDSVNLLQTGNNITDAIVTLSEGSKSVILPYNNVPKADTARSHPYYSVDARLLPIIAGHTYTLIVVTANGQRATSTCTIPTPVQPKDIAVDSLNRRYFIRASWQDPASQINYYQVAGIFRYILTSCKSCQTSTNDNLSFDDDTRGLFSDAGVDESIMFSGRAYLTPSGPQENFYSRYKSASVLVNLMSVDQAYYRYQEAIIRQRRSRNNPFAEPVLIPSNIQGGLGCFAGYNNAVLTLKLK